MGPLFEVAHPGETTACEEDTVVFLEEPLLVFGKVRVLAALSLGPDDEETIGEDSGTVLSLLE